MHQTALETPLKYLWCPSCGLQVQARADVIFALPVAPPPEHLWCLEVASVGGDVSSFTTNCTLHTVHCDILYCILHPAHCVLDRHTSITHFSVEDYGSILYWDFVILCSPNPQSLRRQELAIIEIMLLCYLVSICCNILATCHTC